jgi:ectoine hydroxylase-related dioxygenase (phytanoyl-CoA dioxygenase family)
VTTLLSDSAIERLEVDGYVVVEDVFDPESDFAPLIAEWDDVLSGLADGLIAEGLLTSRHEGLPFAERLVAISLESGRNLPQPFDISLPQRNITAESPMHLGDAIFGLITDDRLLDVVARVIGQEIISNPVQHIRMKLPQRALSSEGESSFLAGSVSMHQDLGVLTEEADAATILSVWVPITDATVENGCLKVIPGSHRRDLLDHCLTGANLGIPDKLLTLQEAVPVPMRAGSALIFGQQLIHGSLDNVTADEVRISMDLRYQPPGQPSGRGGFPSFVARSAVQPESVLRDPEEWRRRWREAQLRLAERELPKFNRWNGDSPACA